MKMSELRVGKPYIDLEINELLKKGTIKNIYGNSDLEKFLIERVHGSVYSADTEQTMLKLLGSKLQNIEDYIFSIKDKNRDDLSLLEIFSLQLYTKKILFKNGIDKNVTIDLFKKANGREFGEASNNGNEITIFNHNYNKSVRGILRTLHHETSHCIMYNMLKNEDVAEMNAKDEDLLDYCKDEILCRLSNVYDKDKDETYYEENQYNLSYEYDAEFRALCMEAILYKRQSSMNHKVEALFNEFNLDDILSASSKIIGAYDSSKMRFTEGKKYTLNDLFLEKINNASFFLAQKAFFLFPSLQYEYNANFDESSQTFSIERKSISQLVLQYEKAKTINSVKESTIYLKIIDKMCDKRYEGEQAKKHINDLIQIGNKEVGRYILLQMQERERIVNSYELKYSQGSKVNHCTSNRL